MKFFCESIYFLTHKYHVVSSTEQNYLKQNYATLIKTLLQPIQN